MLTPIVFSRRRVVEGDTGDFEVFIRPVAEVGDPGFRKSAYAALSRAIRTAAGGCES